MSTTKSNRLILEKSPYLLQHAYNPVDWYSWGEEAFLKAKEEDKPIFLSIGYSTCHWCHVMERECFEDRDVSDLLNKYFISIKVDREERPDIDHIYMSVCQTLTGHGGWPLTVLLTPDRKPFFAGTYFPKHDQYGITGILNILNHVIQAWNNRRDELLNAGEQITRAIQQKSQNKVRTLSESILHEAFRQFNRAFDSQYGGFGHAPKFPSPHSLSFLLRYRYATGEKAALDMVEKTLEHMYQGGIYDHIGFGFCRYSTDRPWLVPHFEKMLYDNALLAIAYLEAFQATAEEKYAHVAKEIFTYVQRDMTSIDGGFYSAEDADSQGVEGLFYTWKPEEVIQVLGQQDGEQFCALYDITARGNFDGRSIPNLISSRAEKNEWIEGCREKLFWERKKRIHPFKDDKILTAWNALMATAFAMGGRILKHDQYINVSKRALHFIETTLTRKDGRLLARYRDGDADIPAYLDDYAFLVWAYLELYEATYEPLYLKKAIDTQNALKHLFEDDKNGGFFLCGKDSEQLLTRPKDTYDGAIPSGNSVTAMNLLRLSRITGNSQMAEEYHLLLHAYADVISHAPTGYAHLLSSYLFSLQPSREVILVSDQPEKDVVPFYDVLQEKFRPFTTTIRYGKDFSLLQDVIPFIDDYSAYSGRTLAYVCKNFSCMKPVENTEAFRHILS